MLRRLLGNLAGRCPMGSRRGARTSLTSRAHDERMREPAPVITAPNGRLALTLTEAARAAGVSRSTIGE